MGYTIHNYDQAAEGGHRAIPIVFRTNPRFSTTRALFRKAGLRIALIEGPSFEMRTIAFVRGGKVRRPSGYMRNSNVRQGTTSRRHSAGDLITHPPASGLQNGDHSRERRALSLKVWRVMQYMGFQPEDRGNQIWVRKSGSFWSAKELVDTINFVHLAIHHGYVIPDQRF